MKSLQNVDKSSPLTSFHAPYQIAVLNPLNQTHTSIVPGSGQANHVTRTLLHAILEHTHQATLQVGWGSSWTTSFAE